MALFEPIGTEASCLEFTASPTNTICKAVSIRVTKGTAPFDLKVNGPITGEATTSNKSFRLEDLPAGTYDITLEDAAGCETTEQFTIDANCGQGSLTDRSTSRSRILEDQVTDLTTPLVLLQHISNTRSPEETPIATRFTTQQGANANSYSGKRRCGTTQLMEDLLQDPAAAQQYQEKKQMAYSGMMQAREDCDQKQVLPIAIHFQGIANPNRACLANLARRQIETLNEDIQARNKEIDTWKTEVYKYFPNTNYGSTCLEFCIATKNHPAGYGLRDGDLALTINRTKGDFDRNWSGYINIFVREIDLLGYSPVGGSGNGDGIVLDVSAFGRGTSCGSVRPTSPYNLGRTLTHEIGHYLLLNHIWGDGCDTDDRLPDTPDAAAPNYGCPPLGVASCGSADLHVNYMDYTDDACLYMFTRLQSSLMEFYVDRFLSNVTSNSSRVCETEETVEQTNSMVVQISGKGSVEINSGDNSSTCNLICSSPFQTGTNMRLMAKAATGYRFVEWEGASCSASSNENCSFTLNENVIIKAIFEAIPATVKNLQIEVIGKGTIESTVNNTMETCRNSCTFKYPQNSSLSLVAKPDAGYRFNKWLESTCNATTSSTCEMMLTGDQRLIAIFEEAATVDDPCILFTATPTPSICNAVSIKITEGVAPFDLTIKGPITGEARTSNKAFRLQDLPAGTYTATLTDAEACEATEQFIIDPNCGQSLTNPVSTSRSITDNTEHVLDLTIQEVATVSRLINNFPPPCLSLPLDYMPSPSDVPSSTSTISRLWDVGQIITVKFLGGDDRELKEKIIQGAREWEKYANITFRFITTGPARIRISFKEAGNYSRIGSDADKIDQEEETMNFFFLDYETDRRIEAVILHEFGHALGLLHEHVHPKNTIQWNKQAVYDYNPNLSTELVDLIYFDLPAQDEVYFCEYDPASVMHYGVDPAHTLNNFSVSPNNLMSQEDKRFIGKLYPFSGVRSELGIGFCSDEPISTDTNKELKIRVKGEGSVVVKAAGTTNTCQRSCTFIYANNLNFQLKAMPQSGYRFVKWSGKYCTNSPLLDCQMNINTNETITAYFEPISNENSCLVFGVTPSNSTCNRGKISIAITAGIAPFKLNLTGPISGDATTNNKSFRLEDLAAGAYTITIKDGAGCESTQAFSIANTCVNAPTSATSSSRSTLRITDESIISEEIEEVRITVGANYPNPFRERTILPFNLVKDGAVQLDIFHSNGQRVYQSTQVLEAGQHQIELGPKELQQAGLYIYHLRVAKEVVTGKMIRL